MLATAYHSLDEESKFESEDFRFFGIASTPFVTPVFRRIGVNKVKKACDYHLHQHDNYEVIMVESGDYSCRINNIEVNVAAGEILILKPGDTHQDLYSPGLVYFHFCFDLQSIDTAVVNAKLFPDDIAILRQVFKRGGRPLVRLAAKICATLKKGKIIDLYIGYSMMSELFWRLIREIPSGLLSKDFISNERKESFTAQLYDFLEKNIYRTQTVDDIARELNISERSLTEFCRKFLKDSPAKIMLKYKIDRAALMLQHTHMTAKEISFSLGFCNQYYFSRCFKRIIKLSPREFKKRWPLCDILPKKVSFLP
jgi:AraC-like DNA-binding protein